MINNSCPKLVKKNSSNNRINSIMSDLIWYTYSKSSFLLRPVALLNNIIIMPVVCKKDNIILSINSKPTFSRNVNTDNTVGQA
ncbi:hypothetical protein BCR32DRAFT_282793 [Anaeromyces robustus]|uniref:Uncharacterized protein n=1 Tax=Anaeromyces robustus TaxID=1754192 RepID=A0A1Y1WWD7_9FUNG|nr:hypothetical protein BCR32DRAFT_282793 [Anaeromyces robustus]|eukprot:ORX77871.1 hypothetical protein BCR32DRAFT_282793 [Anaeromyces robustus]